MKTLCILSFFWCALASGQTLTTINGTDPLSGAPAVINANLLALKLAKMSIPSTYAGGTTYAAGDTVISAGATYASLQSSNTGNTPGSAPTFWMLIAGAGGTGPQGPAGATGATGPQGPQGVPGSGALAATTTALGSVIVPTSGSLSIDGAGNLTITQAALLAKLGAATSTQPGYLLAADWSTFNGKQAALGFTPQNSASPNTNNAGIGNCPAGQYETGNVAGTTPQCAQVQATQVAGTFPFAQLPVGTTANTVAAGNDSRFAPASTLTISTIFGVTGGCNPNTGIKTGGAACTDGGTTAINTAIASLPRPLLVNWDIGVGVTGIALGTQGQIAVRCSPGAGIFVVNGSNSSGFYMSHATNSVQDGLAAASTQGSNVEISGCIVNGNRNSTFLASSPNFPLTNSAGTDPHGNASGDAAGLPFPWLFGMHISNMQGVLLQNNTCIDVPTYCMVFDNVQHASVLNNRIFTKSFIFNQDPIHLNGYTSDFNIRGNFSDQGDDAVALNAPEGYAGSGAGSGISNIRISDENWFNSWNGIRIYAGSNKLISNVVLSNITGHGHNRFMKLGGEGSYGFAPNQLGNISVNNVVFQSDGSPFELYESAAQLNLNGVSFLPSSAPSIFEANNGSSNIQKLNIVSLDPGSITTMANTSGGGSNYTGNPINSLVSIVGTGVQNTGLSIPDARIGNNTTFISDGSGSGCGIASLCWKNNSISQQVLPGATLSGPVQKWLMNEGSGTTFADSSGHANTLNATNTTFTTQTGIPGLTPTFNGSGTSGAVASNATNTNFNGSTSFTVSFWAKRSSTGTLQVLMGNQQSSVGFYVAKQTDDYIYIQLADSAGGLINQKYNYILTAGTPDNLTVTYDGSKTSAGMKLNVNGVGQSINTIFTNTLTGNTSSTAPWIIGNIFGSSVPFAGSIADVRIWNRLLSGAEISALTAAGAQ